MTRPNRRNRRGLRFQAKQAAEVAILRLESLEPRVMLSGTAVTTYRNDQSHDGENLTETTLTPQNVNSSTFGQLVTAPLDGQVYAQPLYVPGVDITAGPYAGVHNVVYACTENDSVYAIDAQTGTVLWQDAFANPSAGITPVPDSVVDATDISPQLGITSTPAISQSTNTMYVVVNTQQMVNGVANIVYQLYALNITSGAVMDGGPALIGDTTYNGTTFTNNTPIYVNGTAPDAVNGVVYFNAIRELQRAALEVADGQVFFSFGAHGTNEPYHGWLVGYNASTLQLSSVFMDTPAGTAGGMWAAGNCVAVDSQGDLYISTGNGTFDTTLNSNGFPITGDYGDSVVKLVIDPTTSATNQSMNGWGLKVVDYFAPSNAVYLGANDLDLGSGGILQLPASAGSAAHPNLLAVIGKVGVLYLLDENNLGKFNATTDQDVQEVSGLTVGGVWGTPTYYEGDIYIFGQADYGVEVPISNGVLGTAISTETPDRFPYPGANPDVSANGATNGIVWAVAYNTDSNGDGQLRAYSAANLDDELYTSDQAANGRDTLGDAVKFEVPTVADGEVFVGTQTGLVIYGLLPTTLPVAPASLAATFSENNGAPQVALSWSAVAGATYYNIYRAPTSGGETSPPLATGVAGTTYTDASVVLGGTYYYTVTAVDGAGEGPMSNEAAVVASLEAVLINFESLPVNASGTTLAEPLALNGFDFTSTGTSAGSGLMIQGTGSADWPGNWPSNVLMAAYWGTVQNVTAAGGGTFTLNAVTLDANYQADSAIVTGYNAAGTAVQQQVVNFTGNSSQAVSVVATLNWSGLARVTVSWWGAAGGTGSQTFGAIENLYLTTAGQTTPTVTVSDSGGTYTGNPYPATALVDGHASLEGVTPTVTYYAGSAASGTPLAGAPSAAGTYTVVGSFAGSMDYTPAVSAPVTFSITSAGAVISFQGLPVNSQGTALAEPVALSGYDFRSTGTSAGSGLMIQGTSGADWPGNWPTNVLMAEYWGTIVNITAAGGGAFSLGSMTLGANYQADSAIITGYSATGAVLQQQVVNFSGNASQDVMATETLNWSGVSLVTVSWWAAAGGTGTQTFGAIENLTLSQSSGGQTAPTLTVSDAGGTFSGNPFPATALVDGGASLESVTPTLAYYSGTSASGTASSTPPSIVGTYTVVASFAGSTDYTSAVSSTEFSVTRAVPTLTVSDAGGGYTGSSFPATTLVNGGAALESVSPTLTYYSGTSASGTASTTAPSAIGTYTVVASFAGSTDYSSTAASTTFSITSATTQINFQNLSVNASGTTLAEPLVISGYDFTSTGTSAGNGLMIQGQSGADWPGNWPANVLMAAYWGTVQNITAAGGALFNVLSMELGVNYQADSAIITAYNSSGTVLDRLVVNFTGNASADAMASETLDWVNVSRITTSWWAGTGGSGTQTFGAIENLTVSQGTSGQTDPAVTVGDSGGTYTGSAFPATALVNGTPSLESVAPTISYYAGSSASGTASQTAPSTVGTYTAVAVFAGSTDYESAAGSVTFSITPAVPAIVVTDAGGVFNSSMFAATDSVAGIGTQSAPAGSLEGITPNLAYYSGTAATGTPLGAAPSVAGTYSALASFAGSTDYVSTAGSATFTITRAEPNVAVSDSSGTYSSNPFVATALVNGGASLESVSATLNYYSGTATTGTPMATAPSTVGTYTVVANFAGSTDYASAGGSTTFSITRAAPHVTLSDASGAYTSSAFAATDSVAGVGSQSIAGGSLEGVTPSLTYYSGTSASGTPLSGAPSAVGTYTAAVSFAGSTDYGSASGSTTFSVTRAAPTVTVSDAGGTYSGSTFAATAKVAGVGSQSAAGTSLESVSPTLAYYSGSSASGTALSGAPSAAGTYTALASFAGSTDYASATGSATFSINRALPTVTVTDAGGTYNGSTFAATAKVAGIGGQSTAAASLEGITPTVAYYSGTTASGTPLSGAPSIAGTYTAVASFSGSTDYSSAAGSATFSITRATASVGVSDVGGTYTSGPFTATDTVSSVGSQSAAAASLEGISPALSYYSGSSASGAALGAAPSIVGTYFVLASFAGSTDYNSAAASATFSISRATPTLNVSDANGAYSAAAFAATISVAGVGSQSTAAASLEGVSPTVTYYSGTSASGTPLSGAPSVVGTYSVAASFAGSTDYNSKTGSATFSITKAVPSVTASDAGGTYSTATFAATAKVAGVGSQSTAAASLEGVTPTLTYHSGTSASGATVTGAPSTAGTYTVVASFAGSTDYASGTGSATFTIAKAVPTVTVTDAGGEALGSTYPATVKVAGVGSQSASASSLESVTPTVAYYSGSSASGTPLSGAPSKAGTYTALGSFAGSTDYTSATGSVTFTITSIALVKGAASKSIATAPADTSASGNDSTASPSQMPWQNPANPLDVIDSGGAIVPEDALVLIDYLNSGSPTTLPSTHPDGAPYLDVLGTGTVTPASVLAIIDYLNAQNMPAPAATSSVQPAATSGTVPALTAGAVDALFAAGSTSATVSEAPVSAAVQAVSSAPAPQVAASTTTTTSDTTDADATARRPTS